MKLKNKAYPSKVSVGSSLKSSDVSKQSFSESPQTGSKVGSGSAVYWNDTRAQKTKAPKNKESPFLEIPLIIAQNNPSSFSVLPTPYSISKEWVKNPGLIHPGFTFNETGLQRYASHEMSKIAKAEGDITDKAIKLNQTAKIVTVYVKVKREKISLKIVCLPPGDNLAPDHDKSKPKCYHRKNPKLRYFKTRLRKQGVPVYRNIKRESSPTALAKLPQEKITSKSNELDPALESDSMDKLSSSESKIFEQEPEEKQNESDFRKPATVNREQPEDLSMKPGIYPANYQDESMEPCTVLCSTKVMEKRSEFGIISNFHGKLELFHAFWILIGICYYLLNMINIIFSEKSQISKNNPMLSRKQSRRDKILCQQVKRDTVIIPLKYTFLSKIIPREVLEQSSNVKLNKDVIPDSLVYFPFLGTSIMDLETFPLMTICSKYPLKVYRIPLTSARINSKLCEGSTLPARSLVRGNPLSRIICPNNDYSAVMPNYSYPEAPNTSSAKVLLNNRNTEMLFFEILEDIKVLVKNISWSLAQRFNFLMSRCLPPVRAGETEVSPLVIGFSDPGELPMDEVNYSPKFISKYLYPVLPPNKIESEPALVHRNIYFFKLEQHIIRVPIISNENICLEKLPDIPNPFSCETDVDEFSSTIEDEYRLSPTVTDENDFAGEISEEGDISLNTMGNRKFYLETASRNLFNFETRKRNDSGSDSNIEYNFIVDKLEFNCLPEETANACIALNKEEVQSEILLGQAKYNYVDLQELTEHKVSEKTINNDHLSMEAVSEQSCLVETVHFDYTSPARINSDELGIEVTGNVSSLKESSYSLFHWKDSIEPCFAVESSSKSYCIQDEARESDFYPEGTDIQYLPGKSAKVDYTLVDNTSESGSIKKYGIDEGYASEMVEKKDSVSEIFSNKMSDNKVDESKYSEVLGMENNFDAKTLNSKNIFLERINQDFSVNKAVLDTGIFDEGVNIIELAPIVPNVKDSAVQTAYPVSPTREAQKNCPNIESYQRSGSLIDSEMEYGFPLSVEDEDFSLRIFVNRKDSTIGLIGVPRDYYIKRAQRLKYSKADSPRVNRSNDAEIEEMPKHVSPSSKEKMMTLKEQPKYSHQPGDTPQNVSLVTESSIVGEKQLSDGRKEIDLLQVEKPEEPQYFTRKDTMSSFNKLFNEIENNLFPLDPRDKKFENIKANVEEPGRVARKGQVSNFERNRLSEKAELHIEAKEREKEKKTYEQWASFEKCDKTLYRNFPIAAWFSLPFVIHKERNYLITIATDPSLEVCLQQFKRLNPRLHKVIAGSLPVSQRLLTALDFNAWVQCYYMERPKISDSRSSQRSVVCLMDRAMRYILSQKTHCSVPSRSNKGNISPYTMYNEETVTDLSRSPAEKVNRKVFKIISESLIHSKVLEENPEIREKQFSLYENPKPSKNVVLRAIELFALSLDPGCELKIVFLCHLFYLNPAQIKLVSQKKNVNVVCMESLYDQVVSVTHEKNEMIEGELDIIPNMHILLSDSLSFNESVSGNSIGDITIKAISLKKLLGISRLMKKGTKLTIFLDGGGGGVETFHGLYCRDHDEESFLNYKTVTKTSFGGGTVVVKLLFSSNFENRAGNRKMMNREIDLPRFIDNLYNLTNDRVSVCLDLD